MASFLVSGGPMGGQVPDEDAERWQRIPAWRRFAYSARCVWLELRDMVTGPPWLRGWPFRQRVRHVPAMLTPEEIRLLYWVTSSQLTGTGNVVECGAFLGGSTAALCAGLRANPRRVARPGSVHVYDRFTYDQYFERWFRALGARDYAEGEDFLPLWKSLNAADLDLLTLHPGDLLSTGYAGGPIEVLFVDVCKTWELNARVVGQFFPHLIPGKSLIIQQDYVHFHAYWLTLTMDWFRDYISYQGRVSQGASALFRLERPLPADLLAFDLRRIPLGRKKEAFERELARSSGYQRTEILVAYYRMLIEAGEADAAAEVARRIGPEARSHPSSVTALTFVPPELLAA